MSGRLLSIYINEEAAARLAAISEELGRDVEELAATSVEEAALEYFRRRNDDPGRKGVSA